MAFRGMTFIEDDFLAALASGFRRNRSVKRLELLDCIEWISDAENARVSLRGLFRAASIQELAIKLIDGIDDNMIVPLEALLDALSFDECTVQKLEIFLSSRVVTASNPDTLNQSLVRLLRTTSLVELQLDFVGVAVPGLCSHLIQGLRQSETLRTLGLPFLNTDDTKQLCDALENSNRLEHLSNVSWPPEEDNLNDRLHILRSLARIQGLRSISVKIGIISAFSLDDRRSSIQLLAASESLQRITGYDMFFKDLQFPHELRAKLERVLQLKQNRAALATSVNGTPSMAPVILESMTRGPYDVSLDNLLFPFIREIAGGATFDVRGREQVHQPRRRRSARVMDRENKRRRTYTFF
jgi:hypothetical protein